MSNIFDFLSYKVIQAPMAGNIVNPSMVATVCNNGILGSIPSGYLCLSDLEEFIHEVKKQTVNPFIVNIFIDAMHDKEEHLLKSSCLRQIEDKFAYSFAEDFTYPATISMRDYVELLIKQQVKFVSSTFGFFDRESVDLLHAHEIQILATVTNLVEAEFCLTHGADALILQGIGAGGYQGNFLAPQLSNLSSQDLLQQVRQKFPHATLIIAGGISLDEISTYLALGANCVQLGTVFMLTSASNLPSSIREYMVANPVTQLSKFITGRYARGVVNNLMHELEGDNGYGFPLQHYATSELRKYARSHNLPEYMALWAGSNQRNLQINSLEDVIKAIHEGASHTILSSKRL